MSTRRLGLFVAWLVATSVAVLLASQAVGLVRDQVTDRPSRTVSTLLVDITTTSSIPDVTEPTAPPASGPTTTVGGATTATTVEPTETTTTTTTPPATATTTTPTTTPETVEFFTLQGGTVSVSCSGDTIAFRTASPKPGYRTDVEKTGPENVEVTFEGSDHESRFKAQCHEGTVDTEIDEHDSDGHD